MYAYGCNRCNYAWESEKPTLCPICGQPPTHEKEEVAMPEIKLYQFQGVVMEQVCPVCKGDPANSPKKETVGRNKDLCLGCKGEGKILTTEGKKLVDFLTNYLPFSQ